MTEPDSWETQLVPYRRDVRQIRRRQRCWTTHDLSASHVEVLNSELQVEKACGTFLSMWLSKVYRAWGSPYKYFIMEDDVYQFFWRLGSDQTCSRKGKPMSRVFHTLLPILYMLLHRIAILAAPRLISLVGRTAVDDGGLEVVLDSA